MSSSIPPSIPTTSTRQPSDRAPQRKRTLTGSTTVSSPGSPNQRRASTSMSSATGFTAGSDWDNDDDDGGSEEWEGGEEVKARRRRKKDEPMSPVAVVCEWGLILQRSVCPPISNSPFPVSSSSQRLSWLYPSLRSFRTVGHIPSHSVTRHVDANLHPSLRHIPLCSLPNPYPIGRSRDPLSPPCTSSSSRLRSHFPTTALSPPVPSLTYPLTSPFSLFSFFLLRNRNIHLASSP